jgi:aspartate/methionine/tyrosine aminotransferase
VKLSGRSAIDATPSGLAEAFARQPLTQHDGVDLTLSNPTRAGLSYAAYQPSAHDPAPELLSYDPDPLGDLTARQAIARHWPHARARPTPERLLLLPSSSEAYRQLFLLLCDVDDEVLAPEPSYPLLADLARHAGVRLTPYRLAYDGAWHIDFDSLRRARSPRSRAIVLISPNNPTGSYTRREEFAALAELGLPLVSDEVFAHYPQRELPERWLSAYGACDVLTFCIDGLSKSAGLPQLKLSWLAASGPAALLDEVMERLAWSADTYLSAATPVQRALPELLARAQLFRVPLLARLRENRAALEQCLAGSAASVLDVEGGWYAMVQLPDLADEDAWVLGLLERRVATHPGYFYDVRARSPHLVLSLLPPPAQFRLGAERLRAEVDRRVARR